MWNKWNWWDRNGGIMGKDGGCPGHYGVYSGSARFSKRGWAEMIWCKKVTDGKRKRPCEVPMTILHKVLISNSLVGFQRMVQGCEKVSFLTIFRMPSFVPWQLMSQDKPSQPQKDNSPHPLTLSRFLLFSKLFYQFLFLVFSSRSLITSELFLKLWDRKRLDEISLFFFSLLRMIWIEMIGK